MKKLLFIIFIIAISCSEQKKFVKTVVITSNCNLGFLKYDKEMDLYYLPYLIKNGKSLPIKNYNHDNGCDLGSMNSSVSSNGKYFIIGNIIKGYVDDGIKKRLHENYLCSIVDIEGDSIVVGSLQERCSGTWNNKNQFIFENEIVFEGNK